MYQGETTFIQRSDLQVMIESRSGVQEPGRASEMIVSGPEEHHCNHDGGRQQAPRDAQPSHRGSADVPPPTACVHAPL